MALLEVSHLGVGFRGADGEKDNTAVDDVSFALEAGEVLGVVGESGSGKSVTALSILGLLPYPKAYHMPGSSVRFAGRELIGATGRGTAPGQRQRKSPLFSGTDVVAESAAYN